jgi:hypothetical protein
MTRDLIYSLTAPGGAPMRVVNVVLVVATLLGYVGAYFQEKKRLATTLALSAAQALARYEAAQKRRERILMGVTALLVAGALAALVVRLRA